MKDFKVEIVKKKKVLKIYFEEVKKDLVEIEVKKDLVEIEDFKVEIVKKKKVLKKEKRDLKKSSDLIEVDVKDLEKLEIVYILENGKYYNNYFYLNYNVEKKLWCFKNFGFPKNFKQPFKVYREKGKIRKTQPQTNNKPRNRIKKKSGKEYYEELKKSENIKELEGYEKYENISGLYVLKLKNDTYYIGSSRNIYTRLKTHFNPEINTTQNTQNNPPLKIVEIKEMKDSLNLEYYENKLTLEYIEKYGKDNVRGGYHTKC